MSNLQRSSEVIIMIAEEGEEDYRQIASSNKNDSVITSEPNDTNEDCDYDDDESWSLIPEPVLLNILGQLSPIDVLRAGCSCVRWNTISKDDYLWKRLFQRDFKVDRNIGLKPGEYIPTCHL